MLQGYSRDTIYLEGGFVVASATEVWRKLENGAERHCQRRSVVLSVVVDGSDPNRRRNALAMAFVSVLGDSWDFWDVDKIGSVVWDWVVWILERLSKLSTRRPIYPSTRLVRDSGEAVTYRQ
jgi:hypothetical protein